MKNSKRATLKLLKKEFRKLFPGMAVYVRRKPGEWNWSGVHQEWRFYLGPKGWSKTMCEMFGCCVWSVDAKGLLETATEDQEKFMGAHFV